MTHYRILRPLALDHRDSVRTEANCASYADEDALTFPFDGEQPLSRHCSAPWARAPFRGQAASPRHTRLRRLTLAGRQVDVHRLCAAVSGREHQSTCLPMGHPEPLRPAPHLN